MKRIMMLAAIALLACGLLGSTGCSRKVGRTANVSAGDYYSDEEYAKLGKDEAAAYCAELAAELERLQRQTAEAGQVDSEKLEQMRAELARLQSQYNAQDSRVRDLQDQIGYFESLPKSYRVLPGDHLWGISSKQEIYADPIKWPRLYRANHDQIKNPNLIYPDQVLSIPRDWPTQHRVQRGEFLSKIAGYWEIYDNYREWTRLYEANRDQIADPDLIYPEQVLSIPR